jgi:predicted DNA-binding transcriptional regulator YafY
MEVRKIGIYNQLFKKLSTKQELADLFKVSTKTIENTIKTRDDIVYSKKLGSYHFKNLLPDFISYQNYFTLFKDSVANPIIKKDFLKIGSSLHNKFNETMIDTNQLSELSKKIIKVEIAINHNCILKVEYTGNDKSKEEKYIQPKQIFTDGSIYYVFLVYDKKNKEKVGEERQFAFNGIESVEPIEYTKEALFRSEEEVNAFGSFKNAKTIRLKLQDAAANYFKREGLFETNSFKFLSELSVNEIEIEMRYNYKLEVIKLVQQWLPQITIIDHSEEAKKILKKIKSNYQDFIDSL